MTPLEALKKLRQNSIDETHLFDNELLDIIETALKRLELLEVEKQSFDRLIEKKLKAFAIIKEKRVRIDLLFQALKEHWSYERIVENHKVFCISLNMLTQEEYDVLKEVL